MLECCYISGIIPIALDVLFHFILTITLVQGPVMKECRGIGNRWLQWSLGRNQSPWELHPQLSHLLIPTSPDLHHDTLVPPGAWPCHPKVLSPRIPHSWGLQKSHRLSHRDTLPVSPPSSQSTWLDEAHSLHCVPVLLKNYGALLSTNFLSGIQGWSHWSTLTALLQPSSSCPPATQEHPSQKMPSFHSLFLLYLSMPHLQVL